MAAEEQAWIQEVLADAFAGGGAEMTELINDDSRMAAFEARLSEDAEITFPVPGGGFIGNMAGPWRGFEGFRAGWREWLQPWESFRGRIAETSTPSPGVVLVLVQVTGRLNGTETEIEQEGASLYRLRDEEIVAIEHYLDHGQARAAAGIGEPTP